MLKAPFLKGCSWCSIDLVPSAKTHSAIWKKKLNISFFKKVGAISKLCRVLEAGRPFCAHLLPCAFDPQRWSVVAWFGETCSQLTWPLCYCSIWSGPRWQPKKHQTTGSRGQCLFGTFQRVVWHLHKVPEAKLTGLNKSQHFLLIQRIKE